MLVVRLYTFLPTLQHCLKNMTTYASYTGQSQCNTKMIESKAVLYSIEQYLSGALLLVIPY